MTTNEYIRGIDTLPLTVSDSLASDPGDRFEIALTNPPFGKKSRELFWPWVGNYFEPDWSIRLIF
jgi:hypothetical protein